MPLTTLEVPSNVTILPQSTSTQLVVQKKKRSRRRFKLPAKTRSRMRAAARRMTIPALSIGANIIPAVRGVGWLFDKSTGLFSRQTPLVKGATLFNAIVSPYTGVEFTLASPTVVNPTFNPRRLAEGALPNIIVFAVNKLGLFRSLNQKLGRAKIPIRLN